MPRRVDVRLGSERAAISKPRSAYMYVHVIWPGVAVGGWGEVRCTAPQRSPDGVRTSRGVVDRTPGSLSRLASNSSGFLYRA